jgi:hypothetical protein
MKTIGITKVQDWGVPCMMVGYALNHPGDTYWMFNLKTGGIHETRNIIWLRQMYFTKSETANKEMRLYNDFDNNNDICKDVEVGEGHNNRMEEMDIKNNNNDNEEDQPANETTDENVEGAWTPVQTRTGHAVVPPAQLMEEIGDASDLKNMNYTILFCLKVIDEEFLVKLDALGSE